jgi:hypothetical protein
LLILYDKLFLATTTSVVVLKFYDILVPISKWRLSLYQVIEHVMRVLNMFFELVLTTSDQRLASRFELAFGHAKIIAVIVAICSHYTLSAVGLLGAPELRHCPVVLCIVKAVSIDVNYGFIPI